MRPSISQLSLVICWSVNHTLDSCAVCRLEQRWSAIIVLLGLSNPKLNGTGTEQMFSKQPYFSFGVQPAAYTQRSLQGINNQTACYFGKHFVWGKKASISKPIHTTRTQEVVEQGYWDAYEARVHCFETWIQSLVSAVWVTKIWFWKAAQKLL